jgi:hypothetical protein
MTLHRHSGARPISGLPEIGLKVSKSAIADLDGRKPGIQKQTLCSPLDSGFGAARRPGMTAAI